MGHIIFPFFAEGLQMYGLQAGTEQGCGARCRPADSGRRAHSAGEHRQECSVQGQPAPTLPSPSVDVPLLGLMGGGAMPAVCRREWVGRSLMGTLPSAGGGAGGGWGGPSQGRTASFQPPPTSYGTASGAPEAPMGLCAKAGTASMATAKNQVAASTLPRHAMAVLLRLLPSTMERGASRRWPGAQ